MNTPSPRDQLQALTTTALLGSDRAADRIPRSIKQPAKDAAPTHPARTLLNHAAVLGLRARAGARSPPRAPLATQAPLDPRPTVPPAAADTLTRILESPDALLLDEWSHAAREHQQRVPDAILPSLLGWWARQSRRSQVIAEVLGPRARWLAELNPDWRRAFAPTEIPPDADERWQTAPTTERAALLALTRAADPARARALLQSTWAGDAADDRRRFLDTLAVNLSSDDEPLLTSALADRSKGVRQRAANLLARLPASAFSRRMRDRLAGILSLDRTKPGLLRKASTKLTLTPPKALDPEWERDTIEAAPPQATSGQSAVGKQAWILQQLIALTNLHTWQDLTGLDPAGIIAALKDDDFFDDAAAGWFRAAELTPSHTSGPDWINALTTLHRERSRRKLPASWSSPQLLWPLLPREHHEALVLAELKDPIPANSDALACLASLPTPPPTWSSDFSHRLVRTLDASPIRLVATDFYANTPLWTLAARIHTDHAKALEAWAAGAMKRATYDPANEPTHQHFADRLRLRIEMHREFKSEHTP